MKQANNFMAELMNLIEFHDGKGSWQMDNTQPPYYQAEITLDGEKHILTFGKE